MEICLQMQALWGEIEKGRVEIWLKNAGAGFFFFWLCGRSLCPLSPAPSLIESEGPLTPQPVTPPQPSSAAGFLSKPFYLLPLRSCFGQVRSILIE